MLKMFTKANKYSNIIFSYTRSSFSSKGSNNSFGINIMSEGLKKEGTESEKIIGKAEKFKNNFMKKEDKEARLKLLKQEITSNPEFFNAFPHLREKIKQEEVEDPADQVEDHLGRNYEIDDEKGIPDVVEKRENYFESMLGQRKGYENVTKSEEEKELESKQIFIEGFHDPKGPIKYMPRAEKEKIHQEIDKRMQELEDSGLSREEILFNKPEGIPLKQDKFFQFIKTNKVAREMLIKPNQVFSADIILEKALKQDIGPDPSLAIKRKNIKLNEDLYQSYEVKKYSELYNPKNPDVLLRSSDYDYKEGYIDKLKLHLNSERTRPVSFINPPMTRGQMRSKFMIHTIKSQDITWRNLPLLVRFLNEGGKILNKHQTRLPTSIHRRLARTVKHARNMGLLPFIDFIKPYHKLPFTSMYNEFGEDTTKVVDVKTGRIKIIHEPSKSDRFTYSSYDSATAADKSTKISQEADKFKNTLLLDNSEIPFMPNLDQRDLLMAQNYLIKQRVRTNSNELEHSRGLARRLNNDELLNKQEEEAYHRVHHVISQKVSPSQLIDSFISEKSFNVDSLKSNSDRDLIPVQTSKLNLKKEISSTVDQINKFIMDYKIDQLKSVDYNKEMKKFKAYKIEADISQKQFKKKNTKITYKKYKL